MMKKIKYRSTPQGRKSKDQGRGKKSKSCNYIHPWRFSPQIPLIKAKFYFIFEKETFDEYKPRHFFL